MGAVSQSVAERMRAEGFIGSSEASRLTGIPRTTLRTWIDTKHVRSARVGRSLFIEIASLKDVAGLLYPKEGETKC